MQVAFTKMYFSRVFQIRKAFHKLYECIKYLKYVIWGSASSCGPIAQKLKRKTIYRVYGARIQLITYGLNPFPNTLDDLGDYASDILPIFNNEAFSCCGWGLLIMRLKGGNL